MTSSVIPRGRLRRLAELRPEHGRVLSVYIDLDPSEFATPPARASQITSVLDAAGRAIDAADELAHDERSDLRADIGRVRATLDPARLGAGGARGVAVFACASEGLLEVVRLPHPVQSGFFLDRTPHVQPLATPLAAERWCVVLANSREGRILIGDQHGLVEVAERLHDDTHGRHDQGGWSQARYQRSIDEERRDHLDHVAFELFQLLKIEPFDRLLIAAPEPLDHELETRLHPYLSERLAGRLQIDVENSGPAEVLAAAEPVFEEHQRAQERAALERMRAGWGRQGGRVAAGVDEVRAALEAQRVEVLLLEPPSPAQTAEREALTEDFVERAIEQAAAILVVHHHPDLGSHGGLAALLRW